jgi:hypothetical protein
MVPTEPLTVSEATEAWKRGHDVPSFEWAGFTLNFGAKAVGAVHIEKLVGFVLDCDALRSPLQTCAQALARELRSPEIVYGPDSFSPFQEALGVEDGSSLAEILSSAQRSFGLPVGTIREMAGDDGELNLDRRCYYVETIDLGKR